MRVAFVQMNPKVGALTENTEKIVAYIEQARAQKADLVLFPELAICGYPPLDLLDHPHFISANEQALDRIQAATKDITVIIGCIARNLHPEGKRLLNAAAVLQQQSLHSLHYKTLLPNYDVFDEERYFAPASAVASVDILGQRVGITICEDLWNDADFWNQRLYTQDPVAALAKQGIDLLINLSASPFEVGKPSIRREMVTTLAKKYQIPIWYLNQVGGNDTLIFDGHSFISDAQGQVTWQADGFQEQICFVDTDEVPLSVPALANDMTMIEAALVLGVRDYLHKSGFSSVILGLSGGIDSAVTAAIAVKALGSDNVVGVAMPSAYSSMGSLTDAQALAQNLAIQYHEIPIAPIYDTFCQHLAPVFVGYSSDVTEENLQARIRGDILMALSNKWGHLLLTTGNKSELAVGYCTLYGDMCGGLAVIADLPKTWVYRLADHFNRYREIIPRNTIVKPPSAELRPDQTDQDTLPPYEILDDILACYIEQMMSPQEIVAQGYEAETVNWVIRRVNFNEYKRRQAAPGLKLTCKAFGPGRRYPIARGYDS